MWAQLIKARLKPGKEDGLKRVLQLLRASEQPGTGLVRSTTMRDQKDPSVVYTMVVFESEEKARAREQDSRRQEGLKEAQATMADIFEGPPEFIDLTVVAETTP
jgi:quinol monooxygenase YgiN